MINRMVWRNLLHRPVRSVLSVLAIAVEVSMILLIVGLAEGLLYDSQQRTRGVGADIMIRPSTSSAAMSLSTADIPEKLIDKLLETFPNVILATGTTLVSQGDLQTITGVDWDAFTRMAGDVRYLQGRALQEPYEAIVDEVYARYSNVRLGDTLTLLNQDFRVVGVVESGKMSRIFVPIDTMQDLMGWRGKLSQIYLKLDDPAKTSQVVDDLKALLPAYPVYAMEEFLSQVAADVREMSAQFVDSIVGIAVVIGFLVVLLAMYTAILERTREVGILKSLGASKTYVVMIVLRETSMLCALGIAVGIAISYAVRAAVQASVPLLTILIDGDWLLIAAALAVVGAMLGSLYPAIRAARQDPIHALTYE